MSVVLRAAVAVFMGGPLAVACAREDPLGPVPTSGTFELVHIDGHALPASVSGVGGQIEVLEGRVRLEAHGRYLQGFLVRTPADPPMDLRDSGAFGGQLATIHFRADETGNRFEGSISGDTLRVKQNLSFDVDEDLEELTFVREGHQGGGD